MAEINCNKNRRYTRQGCYDWCQSCSVSPGNIFKEDPHTQPVPDCFIKTAEFRQDMNALLSIFVSVLIFNAFNCQEQNNFLEGPNVCKRQETYNVTKIVEEIHPVVTKTYHWCFKVPPKCTVYETRNVTSYVNKTVTETRYVDECCKGYMIFGRKCVPACSQGCGNGSCIAPEKCECEAGYTGQSCKEVCPMGKWGMGCTENCECSNASCDPFSGECVCPPGLIGTKCETQCPEGKYGNKCMNDCLCSNEGRCLPEAGECVCQAGYRGTLCEKPCQDGYYGEQCALECHCMNSIGCNPVSGECNCSPGFTGLKCEDQCQPGFYGENCRSFCNCDNDATCDSVNGSCICPSGYIGEKCQYKCPAGSYGEKCYQTCNCNGADCDHITGECNCPEHKFGMHCDLQMPSMPTLEDKIGYNGLQCDCGDNDNKTNMETSIAFPSAFCQKKYKQIYNYNSFTKIKVLTKEERLIFNYSTEGDYKALADKCDEGVNMNIADINDNHRTPLHLAAKKGCVFTILTLIGCGVNINAEDGDGNTALHVAVAEDHSHVCSVLLYNEADPFISNTDMKSAYQLAIDSKDDWIKYIFETNRLQWYHKDRKLKRDEKKLFQYVRKGYYGSVGDLCMKGIDVLVADTEANKNTALHVAAIHAQNIVPMVLTLLRCGGNINVRNAYGNTPLHFAVMKGHVNATSVLLQYRANPFIENNEGKTAHALAIESNDPSLSAIFNEPHLIWFLNTHFFL